MEFQDLYGKVKGIVHRARKDFYVKQWDKDDWNQEGMLALYTLVRQYPEIVDDEQKLYKYFKVKFRNYVKDMVRRQESLKRKFDRMPHEEISSLSHSIADVGMLSDERIMFRTMLEEFKKRLNTCELENYHRLMRGERFNGRKKMLRKLQEFMKDFK